ncbi:MAG: TonB-dependent receptor [Methylococcaceae bacterium]|nr:TonB-dependent receptor [Methylococcaceae bacterium]
MNSVQVLFSLSFIFSVLNLAIFPATAFSNETTQIKKTSLEMGDLIDMPLDDVMSISINVATKTDKKLNTAPSSVSVFTAKEISAMGIKSVQELLNFVPGFQSTRESRFNQGYMVTARGASTPQASYNILFMVDGHRLNDVSSGGALIANHYLTTANIKQIEVIRGPGSALYGTSAFAGIVNIITKDKPEKDKAYKFYLAGGNLDSHEFHGQVSKQEQGWGVSIFGQYYDDNGQTYHYASNFSPDIIEKDQEVYAKFRWQDLRLNLRYSEEEFKGLLAADKDVSNAQEKSARLEYDLLDAKNWKLTLHGSFQQAYIAFRNPNQSSITTKDNEFNIGFNGSYQLNDSHQLLAGLEWRYAKVSGSLLPKRKRDVLGIYIQDQYAINDNLELTLGLRYDSYSDNGHTLNPRIALVYNSDFDATFKVMYGQAFRAPSIRQTSANRGLGNPDLKAEEIKTLEFAWLQSFSKDFHTSVTYFHSWSKNKIDTVFAENFFNRRFVNIDGTVKTSGIEFEIQAKLSDEFSLRSAYTYFLDTEENPRRVAKNMFSLIANYQYKDININLNGYYHSEIEQETRTGISSLDDYWLLNTNIRYKVNDWFTVVGQGHNLLDEEYFSSTKLPNMPNGIPNRGRTYSLGIEVAF